MQRRSLLFFAIVLSVSAAAVLSLQLLAPAGVLSAETRLSKATIPYWEVSERRDSVLVLNNNEASELAVEITAYDQLGDVAANLQVVLAPSENLFRNLRELIAGTQRERERERRGWLELSYDGHPNDLGAQLELISSEDASTIDIPVVFENDAALPRREGLLWLPERGNAAAWVSNSSDESQSVTVAVNRDGLETVRTELLLTPRSSRWLSAGRLGLSGEGESVAGLQLSWQGQAQAISGATFWSDHEGHAGWIPLQENSNRQEARLSLTALHQPSAVSLAGEGAAFPLLLNNLSAEPLEIRLRISRHGAGPTEIIEPEAVLLAAGHGIRLQLEEFLTESFSAETISLEISWQGEADQLLAASYTLGKQSSATLRNPLVEPMSQPPKGGNYPWLLGGGANTTLYVKNTTDQQQFFVAHLMGDDGSEYDFGVAALEAGEVFVADLARLQAEATPDDFGSVIGEGQGSGQLIWAPVNAARGLIGRAVIEDTSGRQLSSFSCAPCSIPTPDSITTVPNSILGFPGDLYQCLTTSRWVNCRTNQFLFNSSVSSALLTYSSDDPSVATIDSAGLATAQSPGTTSLRIGTVLIKEVCDYFCATIILIPIIENVLDMEVEPKITSISPTSGKFGMDTVVTINGIGLSPSPTVNLTGSGISTEVQSATATKIVVKLTAARNASVGSREISVTVSGKTSNEKSFSLPTPNHLVLVDEEGGLVAGCSPTPPAPWGRILTLKVVDEAGDDVGVINVREIFNQATNNTCGNGFPEASPCDSEAGPTSQDSVFQDAVSVNCNSNPDTSCGYKLNWTWQWCGPGNDHTDLGTLDSFSNGYIRANGIKIATSSQPNGVAQPPASNKLIAGSRINP